ncbi:MDR family oxidoreductase [Brachybacterium saurashtrense]|uniref:Oxidoreductase n=1 Tax=Brachybacterium saurashtrense TaxID=556288 RepID=A0A345YK49_9MICO|nr:MDR family oxidoreductase [Brachybacterium saurashtrense]AXK44301.1 oxidoreductase [Brachybacterium saurashtrense]RRR21337.1 oxidoreductase [Brachybacterium saurashtrense]RRR22912.1 oxidoreductase [Brachybacterium saurashtrense]
MRAVLIDSEGAAPRLLPDADESLLEGEIGLDVLASGLNYKDAMALAGKGIPRTHPLIPGIDLVGRVTESGDDRFSAGDLVILNGDGIGESRHGGFATRARVRPDALVRLPASLSPDRAAAIGTAGFTAMLAVQRLEDAGLTPDDGDVLVTGASGGAGSIAIALLAGRGHRVLASTGRVEAHGEYLRDLGAAGVLDRRELSEEPGRPLQSQRFAAAIDGVGSTTLANVLAQTVWGGTVAAYGLAQGPDLPTTVLPFILRGVTLAGINSVECPLPLRERAWDALARELDLDLLDSMTTGIGLSEVIDHAAPLLAGQVRGRTVVEVDQ